MESKQELSLGEDVFISINSNVNQQHLDNYTSEESTKIKFEVFGLTYVYSRGNVVRESQQSETTNLKEKVLKPLKRRNQRVWSFNNYRLKKGRQISDRMLKNKYGVKIIEE